MPQEEDDRELRATIRRVPTWKLMDELLEPRVGNVLRLDMIREVLWERGKLKSGAPL